MLSFLDSVQLVKVVSDGSPGSTASPADSASPVLPVPPTKHHSDSGSDFLAVPIVAIVFTFLYLIAKTIMAPFNNRNRHLMPTMAGGGGLTQEEVAVLQKIQRTLSQMESRVEALETILIEQARTEKKYGSKL